MPISEAEQNRAALAIANAGDDFVALATADPTAAGNNLIAAAGRAEINLGRQAGDPAGEIKNLAAVDFAPTALWRTPPISRSWMPPPAAPCAPGAS